MTIDTDVKQVLVLRHDLKMRYGKGVSQGAHASGCFVMDRIRGAGFIRRLRFLFGDKQAFFTPVERRWLQGGTKKVCVRVDSEQALNEIVAHARSLAIPVHAVTDAGLTEFKGVATQTCCAIGPAASAIIDRVTGDLKLL